MLALVFWNARVTLCKEGAYRRALIDFHRALNVRKPKGLRFSATFSTDAVPWFQPGSEVYEDWYVLSGFGAIDSLNAAVNREAGMSSHRYLMQNTAGASGAIFGLSAGRPTLDELPEAYWMVKPRNVGHDSVADTASNQSGGTSASFWTRSLALGPTEHCLLTGAAVEVPRAYGALHRRRELVWYPQ